MIILLHGRVEHKALWVSNKEVESLEQYRNKGDARYNRCSGKET